MSKPAGPGLGIDYLRWAALGAEPIASMPSPAARQALRQAAGVPRHVAATVLAVGDNTFYRAEKGMLAHPSLLTGDKALSYRRLLGVFVAELARTNPDLLSSILAETKEPTDAP